MVTTVRAGNHVPKEEKLVSLKRRNFKDVDAVLEYITAGIISALNIVTPEKAIRVKKGPNLYLTQGNAGDDEEARHGHQQEVPQPP
jgi:hypothetical protein